MHPRRGILVLEVKDWRLSTILQADKQNLEILGDSGPKTVINPLEQARQYAPQVDKALERDVQLVQADGLHAGTRNCTTWLRRAVGDTFWQMVCCRRLLWLTGWGWLAVPGHSLSVTIGLPKYCLMCRAHGRVTFRWFYATRYP